MQLLYRLGFWCHAQPPPRAPAGPSQRQRHGGAGSRLGTLPLGGSELGGGGGASGTLGGGLGKKTTNMSKNGLCTGMSLFWLVLIGVLKGFDAFEMFLVACGVQRSFFDNVDVNHLQLHNIAKNQTCNDMQKAASLRKESSPSAVELQALGSQKLEKASSYVRKAGKADDKTYRLYLMLFPSEIGSCLLFF